MRTTTLVLSLAAAVGLASAQLNPVEPQTVTRTIIEGRVTTLELAPRFTTTIQMGVATF